MIERELFDRLILAWIAVAACVFVALFFRPAPYGRHSGGSGVPTVSARWGWMIMESPAVWGMVALFLFGRNRESVVALAFLLLWLSHYLRRTLVYPFRLGSASRPLPWSIVAMAFLFQLVNVAFNGLWLFELASPRTPEWLVGPRFVVGVALFVAGTAVNVDADRKLARLRNAGSSYGVPSGGLFRWISSPHYLGEIAIWIGWATATWSLAGLSFALWTIANLVPRARSHHRFCRERIEGYPTERRALLPGLW